MGTIKLQSSDGEVFEVDVEVAKKSATLKTMLESVVDDNKDEVVPITKVRSHTLARIIEWSEYHRNDETENETAPDHEPHDWPLPTDDICEWDKSFVMKMDMHSLFELILAASFLDIKDLLDLACKAVANQIQGKTPHEMRMMFNLPKIEKTEKKN